MTTSKTTQMKQGSLFCAGIWPFLIAPILLLHPALFFSWQSIEDVVARNANESLGSEFNWARVETFNRGRDVLLLGTAPNTSAVTNARELIANADGVRTVDFVGDIDNKTPPKPATLELTHSDEGIVLSGLVGSQIEIDEIVAQASAQYPQRTVLNQLTVAENIAPHIAYDGILEINAQLPASVNFSLVGDALTLLGNVASKEEQDSIAKELAKHFSGKINNSTTIVELVEHDECEDLLDRLMKVAKINFETAKASIREDSISLIESLADTTQRCPEAVFEVSGHTDSQGAPEMNMALSQQRAQAVVNRLVALGVKAQRFSVKGYGQNQPIADNNTAAGKAANRRIEFKLKN